MKAKVIKQGDKFFGEVLDVAGSISQHSNQIRYVYNDFSEFGVCSHYYLPEDLAFEAKKETETTSEVTFRDITNQMAEIHEAKNHDYGGSFDKTMDQFGMTALVIRLTDKLNRLTSLIDKPARVTDESINDTLMDICNYSVMGLVWRIKHKDELKS